MFSPRDWLCIHFPWSLALMSYSFSLSYILIRIRYLYLYLIFNFSLFLPLSLALSRSAFLFSIYHRKMYIFKNAKHFSLRAIKFRFHCWSWFFRTAIVCYMILKERCDAAAAAATASTPPMRNKQNCKSIKTKDTQTYIVSQRMSVILNVIVKYPNAILDIHDCCLPHFYSLNA